MRVSRVVPPLAPLAPLGIVLKARHIPIFRTHLVISAVGVPQVGRIVLDDVV